MSSYRHPLAQIRPSTSSGCADIDPKTKNSQKKCYQNIYILVGRVHRSIEGLNRPEKQWMVEKNRNPKKDTSSVGGLVRPKAAIIGKKNKKRLVRGTYGTWATISRCSPFFGWWSSLFFIVIEGGPLKKNSKSSDFLFISRLSFSAAKISKREVFLVTVYTACLL